MATSHESEHGVHHPSTKQYVVIAIILFVITMVEFVLIWDRAGINDYLGLSRIPLLIFLSAIKFAIVILFYMHLKFDNPLFFRVFMAGLVLAFMVGLSLIGLFTAIKGDSRDFAQANATAYAGHEEDGHGAESSTVTLPTIPPPPTLPPAGSEDGGTGETSTTPAQSGSGTAPIGEDVVLLNGCQACHSIDGSVLVGPSWKGIFGSSESLEGGGTAIVNEDYIRESIREPNAKIVEGFTPDLMPILPLTDADIDAVIEYIQSVQ